MMGYPIDFSKPTTYWGHEYHLLKHLNRNQNKLIFVLRNYKENIISRIIIEHRKITSMENLLPCLSRILKKEVLNNKILANEYFIRLQLFDNWEKDHRLLIDFKDLVKHPENFVPDLMEFIEDDSPYEEFIRDYDDYKTKLLKRYTKKGNRTGSGESLRYFVDFISPNVLKEIDHCVKHRYPTLWKRYLHSHETP